MTDRKEAAAKDAAHKATTEAKVDTAKEIGATTTAAAIAKARGEGVIEAEKEAAKEVYRQTADAGITDAQGDRWPLSEDVNRHDHLLTLDLDAFEKLVADEERLAEDLAAGLLKLERAGKNRTQYVQALMARLNVKSPLEVTSAGPGYTNDVRPITKL